MIEDILLLNDAEREKFISLEKKLDRSAEKLQEYMQQLSSMRTELQEDVKRRGL